MFACASWLQHLPICRTSCSIFQDSLLWKWRCEGPFHIFPDSIFFPKDLSTNNYLADDRLVKSQTTKLLILSLTKCASIKTIKKLFVISVYLQISVLKKGWLLTGYVQKCYDSQDVEMKTMQVKENLLF